MICFNFLCNTSICGDWTGKCAYRFIIQPYFWKKSIQWTPIACEHLKFISSSCLLHYRAPYDPNSSDQNCETYEDHVQETGEKKRVMLKDARRILGNARLRHSRKLKKGEDVNSRGPAENSVCCGFVKLKNLFLVVGTFQNIPDYSRKFQSISEIPEYLCM